MKSSIGDLIAKAELELEIIEICTKHLEKYREQKTSGVTGPKIDAAMQLGQAMVDRRKICQTIIDSKTILNIIYGVA
jgi:hypothetical protein